MAVPQVVRAFSTRGEAWAFREGIEFVNDTSLTDISVIYDGMDKCGEPWKVVVVDDSKDDPPREGG
jgi:hypothetical protein